MSKSPFFSIILPVYNRAGLVHFSIQSVLRQTFSDFELICVDDGSTDNSRMVLQDFAQQDHRIKIIHSKDNLERCRSRNMGIKMATGKWLCFIDSDDIYHPNHLAVLHRMTSKYQHKAFATEQTVGGKQKVYYHPRKMRRPLVELTFPDFIYSNPIQLCQLCTWRGVEVLFPDEYLPVSEDWYFMRELSLRTKILKVNTVTTDLREHRDRTVTSMPAAIFVKWNIYTAEKFVEEHDLPGRQKNNILSHIYLLCAHILHCNGISNFLSRACLLKALSFISSYPDPLLYKTIVKLIQIKILFRKPPRF